MVLLTFDIFSPGVVITELQKRGGLGPEAYAAVSTQECLDVRNMWSRLLML